MRENQNLKQITHELNLERDDKNRITKDLENLLHEYAELKETHEHLLNQIEK